MNPSPTASDEYSPGVHHATTRDFVDMLHGIIPALDRIKRSIEESSCKIPTASNQLSNVTSATERATVEILNALDKVMQRLTAMEQSLQELRVRSVQRDKIAHSFRDMMLTIPGVNGKRELFLDLWQQYLAFATDESTLKGLEQQLHETNQDAMNIAMALQVQDITSQQIAGVTHMIETVQDRLSSALHDFEHPVATPAVKTEGTEPQHQETTAGTKAFDSGAIYDTTTDRQEEADEIIQQWMKQRGA